jgi:hypothetical protein
MHELVFRGAGWVVLSCLAGIPLQAQGEPVEAPPILRFPKDLARNFVGLASADNLKPLLAGGLLTGAAVIPEQNVENYFGRRGEAFSAGLSVGRVFSARLTN